MRHRYAIQGLTAAAVAFALTGALRAQDATPPEGSRTVKGTIVLVQKETSQFLLRTDDGKEFIITADGATRVRSLERDAQATAIKVADLKEGLVTSVTYLPKTTYFQAIYVDALGRAAVVKQEPRSKEAGKPDVEPITVMGRIEHMKSDLSEITLKTFDDKEISFLIEEDLRTKLKSSRTNLPDLSKGAEVSAVYVIENGKNKMVVLRDLLLPTKPVEPAAPMPPTSRTETKSTVTTQDRRQVLAALPFIPAAIPVGFAATTQNPLGAVEVRILQITGDMVIVTTGAAPVRPGGQQQAVPGNPANPQQPPMATPPAQNPQPPVVQPPAKPPSPPFRGPGDTKKSGQAEQPPKGPVPPGAQQGAGQQIPGQPGAPAGNQPPVGQVAQPDATGAGQPGVGGGVTAELLVLLGMNSREPYLVDQATRITMGNQNIQFANLREGAEVQATFDVAANGQRRIRQINVLRDGGPIANQGAGQGAQNPAGQRNDNARPNAGNVVAGRIARNKGDLLFLQAGNAAQAQPGQGGQFVVIMQFNSFEPLRMDEGTRFSVDGREARLADLQGGMTARVFVELINSVGRVIGVAATQNGTAVDPNNRRPK